MEKRKPGELTTLETRAAANETVNKGLRYRQILDVLENDDADGMTAKEIAVVMYNRGDIPTSERNFTAPRLTELGEQGIVEPIGKKFCTYTGRKVTVWGLRSPFETKERA
ncbi:MAG: hypothetical protein J5787_05930 [Alphaproteobacteria bacterium]|nr:hypothetical protein [Alphaproteobacteria bacterium]